MEQKKYFKDLPTYLNGFHDDSLASSMVYSRLGKTKLDVSLIGFGGSELKDVYGLAKENEGIKTVVQAIKSGINYIDTAPYYGQGKAEIVLGKALKLIPRSTYYLATKVGRYGVEINDKFDFSAARTLKSVEESFSRLGVDHIDLLQVHDVEFAQDVNIIINETLPVLQNLKDSGKISYIGITGYSLPCLKKILEKSVVHIDTVLSYCRCTLFNNALRNYIPYFKEKELGIINAAVLGMGLLTNWGTPDWHPAELQMKVICKEAANYCKERNVNISKLAASYAFSQPDIHVHLIGMEKESSVKDSAKKFQYGTFIMQTELLEVNLSSLSQGLTTQEFEVMEDVIERFYKKLLKSDWEDKEPQAYWEELKKNSL